MARGHRRRRRAGRPAARAPSPATRVGLTRPNPSSPTPTAPVGPTSLAGPGSPASPADLASPASLTRLAGAGGRVGSGGPAGALARPRHHSRAASLRLPRGDARPAPAGAAGPAAAAAARAARHRPADRAPALADPLHRQERAPGDRGLGPPHHRVGAVRARGHLGRGHHRAAARPDRGAGMCLVPDMPCGPADARVGPRPVQRLRRCGLCGSGCVLRPGRGTLPDHSGFRRPAAGGTRLAAGRFRG